MIRALAAAIALSLLLSPVAASAVSLFDLNLERTSDDPEAPTFGGFGQIGFDSVADDPASISLFSLTLETMGTDAANSDTIQQFIYGNADIGSVIGLTDTGSGISGLLSLGPKTSVSGEVQIGGFGDQSLVLNFSDGTASAFCFRVDLGGDFAECVRGGGSSTGMDALLSAKPVPLPASLSMMLIMLAAFCIGARRGRIGAAVD